ncbi:TraB/GumN family protein [Janthinobacterium sp.]|uniref:TraB/GumN family protein n=1 Tax=Janthinobacterium sp. TaxID=1871054 RepID=UPI00293D3141|nr:TraB/GumN family protein [Janthinobacterium sp.]
MRRQIIVMFCGFFLLAAPAARDDPAAAQRQAAGEEVAQPNRGALFRVEHAGHTLYLFGTIHVGAADFYPLEARVTAALRRATTLALEIDPDADPAAAAQALRRYGMYTAGGPAAAEIAPSFRPRLERLLKQYAIAPAAVAPMKPWLLASVLAVSEFSAQGYRPELAVDAYLARQARARGIAVLELESMAGQMALFDRMSLAEQARFLEDGISAIEDKEQANQARAIAQAWRGADAAAFEGLAREAAADQSFAGRFVQKVLLDERNPGLAEGIAALLARDKDSMAAIGVLHLVGARGVPALLRERGLRVERVY